ncbi:hypothetical protein K1719_043266 [Acacia pycnantha]|nr:hypothetical protein K1719_043266 [Acacia pycnantha]
MQHKVNQQTIKETRTNEELNMIMIYGEEEEKKILLERSKSTRQKSIIHTMYNLILTLRLDNNHFSCNIPILNLPNLQDFNAPRNRLSGEIPKSQSGFLESSFGLNLYLCGASIQKCTNFVVEPSKPGSEGAIASP